MSRVATEPAALRKYIRLKTGLSRLGRVLVAFSGGADSTLLLKAAIDALGPEAVLAVIAASETYPGRETREARRTARALGARARVIATRELEDPGFRANPPLRCYRCKKELFGRLREIADREGIAHVLDGSNADDRADFRPGAQAKAELGIRSPLQDAGLTKAEIRALSRRLGLPTWNKPSLACLASRFPYGTPIEPEALARVGRAEDYLRRLGLGQLRVRHHGTIARIEVEPNRLADLVRPEVRARLVRRLKALGYDYVTLDLLGYRTGSLNEALKRAARRRRK